MTTESWRPVMDWEGVYEVSDLGQVRRVAPRPDWEGGNRLHPQTGRRVGVNPERLLKPMLKNGYPAVCLSHGLGTEKWPSVHTLVARAFLGPRPSKAHTVNHLNGNKADNRLTNLEWATMRRQHAHALENSLRNHASFRRLTDEQALEIYTDRSTTGREFARRFGVGEVTVSSIRLGRSYRWATGAAKLPEKPFRVCSPEICNCGCHYGRQR